MLLVLPLMKVRLIKKSEMEIMVRLATSELGLESRHYKTVDLEAGDAGTITETLLDTFTEDGVDYKAKMISVDMDGCNTMQGKKTGKFNLSFSFIVYLFYITGVITRLRAEVPQLVSLGSSNAHNIANAMMHAVTAVDPDMKQAMVDLYFDIGGAKGKGLKKMKKCQAVAKAMGMDFKPIKKFVSTRLDAYFSFYLLR